MQRRADGVPMTAPGQSVDIDPINRSLVIQPEPMGHQHHAFASPKLQA